MLAYYCIHHCHSPLRPLDWSDIANEDGVKGVRETLHQFFACDVLLARIPVI